MTEPRKFRKKPVVIEAEQFREMQPWPSGVCGDIECGYSPVAHVHTLEGTMYVNDGDWVVRGIAGEHYAIRPDIFAATYEPVGENPPSSVTRPSSSRPTVETFIRSTRHPEVTSDG